MELPRHGRSRLSDVAKLAGVSLGSASRALNNPSSVRPPTLEAVRKAAEQLSYVPDGNARSLVLRRSNTIGSVMPTLNNPVYADFLHFLQQGLSEAGYSLICSAHEYDQSVETLLVERLLQRGVDGLVLVGTDHDEALLSRLGLAGIPHLFTWSTDERSRGACVGFSNRRAMQKLTRHLIELGHREIAVLSGAQTHNERARARLAGIVDVMALHGLDLPPENVITCRFDIEAGRKGLREALALPRAPTAIMCTTDMLAAGALSEAIHLGLTVPADISITGFDVIASAQMLSPPLTTIHVSAREMGLRSSEAIIRAIHGDPHEGAELGAELVVRGSTGPVRGKQQS